MRVRILGSAAGGGVPQWNCGCANCRAVRENASHVTRRTQSSVAITADDQSWFLLNVSADVRQQLVTYSDLGPAPGFARDTPIAGCLLTDAELDHSSGLLQLREGSQLTVYSTPLVRKWLNAYLPIEPVVSVFSNRTWVELPLDVPLQLAVTDGRPAGMTVTAFETGRDVPRYVPEDAATAVGSVVGLSIVNKASGGKLVYAPGVPAINPPLEHAVAGADLVLLDGSFWSDDEPQEHGITTRTSQQMGHLPVSGSSGSLQWFKTLSARHRVYIHINNTNPMLDECGREHTQVRKCGVHVGFDGDEYLI